MTSRPVSGHALFRSALLWGDGLERNGFEALLALVVDDDIATSLRRQHNAQIWREHGPERFARYHDDAKLDDLDDDELLAMCIEQNTAAVDDLLLREDRCFVDDTWPVHVARLLAETFPHIAEAIAPAVNTPVGTQVRVLFERSWHVSPRRWCIDRNHEAVPVGLGLGQAASDVAHQRNVAWFHTNAPVLAQMPPLLSEALVANGWPRVTADEQAELVERVGESGGLERLCKRLNLFDLPWTTQAYPLRLEHVMPDEHMLKHLADLLPDRFALAAELLSTVR